MGKQRSPLLGYNHNVRHRGRTFHIQTEDSGLSNPRIFTHLFFEGTILVSRRREYDPAMDDDPVRGLMKEQQKAVIRDLSRGVLDERIVAFFRARGQELDPPAIAAPPPVMVTPPEDVIAATVPAAPAPASTTKAPPDPIPSAPVDVPLSAESSAPHIFSSAPPPAPSAPAAAPAQPRKTTAVEVPRKRQTPVPVVVVRPQPEAAAARRPPFVRSGAPAVATTSSTDGVVVQRSVVIGGGSGIPVLRPARIRSPVAYVVAGGGTPPREVSPAPAAPAGTAKSMAAPAIVQAHGPQVPMGTAPMPAIHTPAAGAAAHAHAHGAVPIAPAAVSGSAPVSAVEAPRTTIPALGGPLANDKSLDEVILEYLSDDGESE